MYIGLFFDLFISPTTEKTGNILQFFRLIIQDQISSRFTAYRKKDIVVYLPSSSSYSFTNLNINFPNISSTPTHSIKFRSHPLESSNLLYVIHKKMIQFFIWNNKKRKLLFHLIQIYYNNANVWTRVPSNTEHKKQTTKNLYSMSTDQVKPNVKKVYIEIRNTNFSFYYSLEWYLYSSFVQECRKEEGKIL